MPSPVIRFEIGCRDREKTADFYRGVFDWDIGPGPNPGATEIAAAAGGIAGHIVSLGHEPHNYVTVYMQVADIPATLDRIEAAGGQRLVGPVPLPQGGSFAWFRDPDGTVLGLLSDPS